MSDELALLRVCHHVYYEAIEILYKVNVFNFDLPKLTLINDANIFRPQYIDVTLRKDDDFWDGIDGVQADQWAAEQISFLTAQYPRLETLSLVMTPAIIGDNASGYSVQEGYKLAEALAPIQASSNLNGLRVVIQSATSESGSEVLRFGRVIGCVPPLSGIFEWKAIDVEGSRQSWQARGYRVPEGHEIRHHETWRNCGRKRS